MDIEREAQDTNMPDFLMNDFEVFSCIRRGNYDAWPQLAIARYSISPVPPLVFLNEFDLAIYGCGVQ